MNKANGQSLNRNQGELSRLFDAQKNNKDDHEETIINWQTKIFSRSEFDKYTNSNFEPTSILEEHYKEECVKLK